MNSINWPSNGYLNVHNPSPNASGTAFKATYIVTVVGNQQIISQMAVSTINRELSEALRLCHECHSISRIQ
jgi:hypothetical protein